MYDGGEKSSGGKRCFREKRILPDAEGLKSVDVQGRCRESTIYAEKWNFSGEIVLCVIVTCDNSDNIYLTSSTTFGKQERQLVEWYSWPHKYPRSL